MCDLTVRLVEFHQESYLRLFKQRRFYFWRLLEMGGLHMSNNIDLSSFSNVFCDSKNALLSAYDNGLSHDALIRTSSPALLFDNNTNIHHVESRWTINELREFQESIQVFCQDIYDAIPSDGKLSHAEKLVVAYTASQFQKILVPMR